MGMSRSAPIGAEGDEGGRRRSVERIGPDYRKIANKANNYLIDWEIMRTEMFLGVQGFHTQDALVTEGMGSIVDRTREHLGVSDTQIAAARQLLLKAVTDVEQGLDPPGLVYDAPDNHFEDIYCVSAHLPLQGAWNRRELATQSPVNA
jgi:hypothetical protein